MPLPLPQSALLAAPPRAPPRPISTILFDWRPVRAPAVESPLRHPPSLFRLPCGHCICAIATSGGGVQQCQVPGATHAAASRVATGPSHLPHSEPPPPPLFAGRRHSENVIRQYLVCEARRLRQEHAKGWVPSRDHHFLAADVCDLCSTVRPPQQQNGYDCGVFMLAAVLQLSRGKKLAWQQPRITALRARLVLALAEKSADLLP